MIGKNGFKGGVIVTTACELHVIMITIRYMYTIRQAQFFLHVTSLSHRTLTFHVVQKFTYFLEIPQIGFIF